MKGWLIPLSATALMAQTVAQQLAHAAAEPGARPAAASSSLYRRYTELRAQPAETAEQAERLITQARKLLAEDPEFAPAYMLLGKGLYYRGRRSNNDAASFRAAREAFETALQLDRQLLPASAELAILLHRQGRPGAARDVYYDTFREHLAPLAYLNWREGRLAEAHRWVMLAGIISPEDDNWRDYSARIATSLGHYAEAVTIYEELIRRDFRGTFIRASLADVYWAAGDKEAARTAAAQTFDYVDRTTPELVGTRYADAARLALRFGERDRALRYARKGLELRPRHEALNLLVAHLLRGTDPQASNVFVEVARGEALTAISAGATDWSHRLDMAAVHALSGHAVEALATLREAVEAGYRGAAALDGDPLFAPLRSTPDFQAIIADMRARVMAERAALYQGSRVSRRQVPARAK